MSLGLFCSFITRWFLHSHTCQHYPKVFACWKNVDIVQKQQHRDAVLPSACSNLTKLFAYDPELCDGMEMCSKSTFRNLKASSWQKRSPWDVQKLPDEPSACRYKWSGFVETLSFRGSVSMLRFKRVSISGFVLIDVMHVCACWRVNSNTFACIRLTLTDVFIVSYSCAFVELSGIIQSMQILKSNST